MVDPGDMLIELNADYNNAHMACQMFTSIFQNALRLNVNKSSDIRAMNSNQLVSSIC